MVVVDALMSTVLLVELEYFIVFANSRWPIVGMVFVKNDDGVTLAACNSSTDANTHTYKSGEYIFSYLSIEHMYLCKEFFCFDCNYMSL